MIPTKTLITLLRATPFCGVAFDACLNSGAGERLMSEEDIVALGYGGCAVEEQDCLPLYEALAQYQTNLKDEKYKQAFFDLLKYYASIDHPYVVAMTANALQIFHELVGLFPKVGIYLEAFNEIKGACYDILVSSPDDRPQQSVIYMPCEGLLKALPEVLFFSERDYIISMFGNDERYQAFSVEDVDRVKGLIESLMMRGGWSFYTL